MFTLSDHNPPRQLALDFIKHTGRNVFLTGNAGTGKTTFLHQLKALGCKRTVVVAPTGVAAINAGGMTIHSFFQLPFGPQLPDAPLGDSSTRLQRFSRQKINIIRTLDLLVIDEISMVRADLLDAIDKVLRRYRDRNKPFGGVQLLMIGDLQQLAPVARDGEWNLLKPYYESMYFFSSHALSKTDYVGIELKHIYRQSDQIFIDLLNSVRNNALDAKSLAILNSRYRPGFKAGDSEGYVTLTTHNHQARSINNARLAEIPVKEKVFKAVVEGDFPEHAWPADFELRLKIGAQVMFVKNDPNSNKRFFNGKTGTLVDIEDDLLYVKCPDDDMPIAVEPLEWNNTKYLLNESSGEISENVIGVFRQYPLKLAWAITIHKSQGLTFDKAIIDAHAAFAHGQVYVALSRCRSLDGLVLSSTISPSLLNTDHVISRFTSDIRNNEPDNKQLQASRTLYQRELIEFLFDFRPVQYTLGRLHRAAGENKASLDEGLDAIFANIAAFLKDEIVTVSERFERELNRLLDSPLEPEKNPALQERIKKACIYFTGRIEKGITSVIDALDIESDNKAVKKLMDEALQRFMQEVNIRSKCFESCREGFSVEKILEARALASIEKAAATGSRKAKAQAWKENSDHPDLLNELRAWRDKKAAEDEMPIARILPRRTMIEISNKLPGDKASLTAIYGFGKKKVEKYGQEILALVNDYCSSKGLTVQKLIFDPFKDPEKEKVAKTRIPTKDISLELFLKGFSVNEIAMNRNLSPSTIEAHLARCVKSGELQIEKIVSPEKIDLITDYFHSVDDFRLTPAREVLGEDITYNELRNVLNHIVNSGQLDHKPSFREFLAHIQDSNKKND